VRGCSRRTIVRAEVAGLVLVDATTPSILTTGAEVGLPPIDQQGGSVVPFLASSGLPPMAMSLGIVKSSYDDRWNELPPEFVPALKAFMTSPQNLKHVGRIAIRRHESPIWRVTPSAPTRPTRCCPDRLSAIGILL
jgi:hypothetical protein